MYNGRLDLIQILERVNDLHDDRTSLAFGNALVLFQVKVKIVTITVFEYGAERVRVDLEHIEQSHHTRVVQLLVNVVLSQCVFDVVRLFVVLPVFVQLMYLAGDVALLLQVEGFVDFGKATWRGIGSGSESTRQK